MCRELPTHTCHGHSSEYQQMHLLMRGAMADALALAHACARYSASVNTVDGSSTVFTHHAQ